MIKVIADGRLSLMFTICSNAFFYSTIYLNSLFMQLGQTNVQFIDRRIMFGQVPLHVTTTRTAMLKNTSLNHAYFQVTLLISRENTP